MLSPLSRRAGTSRGIRGPTRPIALFRGEVTVQLRVREDGTKIDRLFMTPSADEEPEP